MRTVRFFVAGTVEAGSRARLSESDSRHAERVLRLEKGAVIVAITESGSFHARVVSTGGARTEVEIGSSLEATAWDARLELAVGWAHGPAMDATVRMATELGVSRIVPLRCRRGEHPGDAVLSRRRARWARIAREAVKQCGRSDVPTIDETMELPRLLEEEAELRILADPVGGGDVATWSASCLLVVGPEGGFEPAERRLLIDGGYVPLNLGPWTLRVATAAASGLSRAIASHE